MTASVVQFATAADYVLETEERLTDLVDCLVEQGQRLAALEQTLVEAAGADPLAEILARLDAFENRLAKLELRQRRPPPFPITVVENVDSQTQRRLNELSGELAGERYQRTGDDRDLRQAHRDAVAAFNQRLDRCADQFCRMRERLAAVEARTADKGATT
jgi:primosomal protein N''